MKFFIKCRQYYKTIVVTIAFILLTLSIASSIYEIYEVSSSNSKICVPIIMYHQVKDNNFGKDVISPTEFESDLQYLKDNKYNTIFMTQLIDYVYNGTALPNNPIILTFDDGYLNTYKNVYPLLKKYDMKIVLSVVGKTVDDFSKVIDDNINYASTTWDQIKEMSASGHVEIQNHSYNLHKIKNGRYGVYQKNGEALIDYETVLSEDFMKLQEIVEEVTEKAPNTFTYPYGKYNNNTEDIIKKLGFKATLSCTYGVNLIDNNPEALYGLRRMCRSHRYPMAELLKDGTETLKYRND